MKLVLKHQLNKPVELPINYNYILQSIIYKCICNDNDVSTSLDNSGYQNGKRQYKLFQFSNIKGHYRIKKETKSIIFDDDMTWEIRSVDNELLNIIADSITRKGIRFDNQEVEKTEVTMVNCDILCDIIKIKMDTPICVYSTLQEKNNWVEYYSPCDVEFAEQVNDNFRRKYKAYTGCEAESDVIIELIKCSPKDRIVTRYKGKVISGWKGLYMLKGKPEYLNFLYHTGLGARNSQGFGMFSVL